MTVCPCNGIDAARVEDAARRILARDPGAPLTTPAVFHELGAGTRCGRCCPAIAAVIAGLLAEALREIDGAGLARVPPIDRLVAVAPHR